MSDTPEDLQTLEAELARLAGLMAEPSTPVNARAQLRARFALLQQQATGLHRQQAAG